MQETGEASLIPGLGRSPGGRPDNPPEYSCLENSMDRGAWQTTVHGVTKSQTWLKRLSTYRTRRLGQLTQSRWTIGLWQTILALHSLGCCANGSVKECLSWILRLIWVFPKVFFFCFFRKGGGNLKEEIVGKKEVKNKEAWEACLPIQ